RDLKPRVGRQRHMFIRDLYDREPLQPDEEGNFILSLQPDEIVILYGLPLNTQFSIDEIGMVNGGGYTSTFKGIEVTGGTTSGDVVNGTLTTPTGSSSSTESIKASVSAIYTNTLDYLNQIRILKFLSSTADTQLDENDQAYEFHFQITLMDSADNKAIDKEEIPFRFINSNDSFNHGQISLTNGVGKFTLKNLQEIEIYDLPSNTQWEIQELNGDTPINVDGKVDNKYLLTFVQNGEGTLSSTSGVPSVIFNNLKVDSNSGGLKILAGNRPTDLQSDEFKFVLKGISAKYEPNQNDSEMSDHEESSDSTESEIDSSTSSSEFTTETPEEGDQEETTESNSGESTPEEDKNHFSSIEDSKTDLSEDSSSQVSSDSTATTEEIVSEETSPSTEDASSKESQEESSFPTNFESNEESVVRLKVKRMNRYIQPMSINIAPNLAQYLSKVEFLKEKISSSVSLLSPFMEGAIGIVEGTVDLPPMPEGSKGNSYIFSLDEATGNAGTFSFPEINFEKPGTYIYELSEEIPNQTGSIVYDSTHYWVQVIVGKKSNTSNELEVKSIDYFIDEDLHEQPTDNVARFINTYVPPTTPPGGGGGTSKPSISLVKEQRRITNGMSLSWNKLDRNNPMQVTPGDQIEYRITASNTSNTTAQNVVIKDTLPIPEGTDAQLVLDQASLEGQDVTLNGRELTWKVGNLTRKGTSGASKSVTFKVNVPEVIGHTIWPNTATATFGPNPDNPSGSITSNTVVSEATPGEIIPGEAHIRLLKEQRKISGTTASDWNTQDRNNPMIVAGGDIVEYRLTATASGDKALSNVVIQDKIPDFEGAAGNLTLIPGSLSGEVNVNNGVITWNLGSMLPGESKSVTFQVVVPITEG
ncbi:MAG: DUF11 domain-containing protein, partial [Allobaculum sp.]|nr:DUF11 domain-containing protein [Allobaculum sp.]